MTAPNVYCYLLLTSYKKVCKYDKKGFFSRCRLKFGYICEFKIFGKSWFTKPEDENQEYKV